MKKGAEEKVFTNWTVKELLGKGAFGRVYRIEREEFGTRYEAAMKKITIPQTNEEIEDALSEGMDEQSVTSYFKSFVEEIVNEFKLMAQLKGHTNIVSYEDHLVIPHGDNVGWDILIRMELLKSLKTLTAERNLTEEEVIRLGMDICNALEVCGKMNIIHRDIKPENIFISNFGEFKLGDFGIARTAEKTMSNLSKKGTYTYMAPEVYKGEAYDATVDIYSLGIVMYRFMNYNRAPFLPPYPQPISFSDREVSLTRRISEEPMPAPACGSKELKRIILKACAYQASARYRTPAQFKSDLEKLLRNTESAEAEKNAAKEAFAVPFPSAVKKDAVTAPGAETMAAREIATVPTWEEPEETATVSAWEEPEETATVSAWEETGKPVTAPTGESPKEPGRSVQSGKPESFMPQSESRDWDDTMGDEDSTVSMFDKKPEDIRPEPVPASAAAQSGTSAAQKAPKKKKTGIFIVIGIIAALLAAAVFLVTRIGGGSTAPSGEFDGFSYMETSKEGEYDDLLTGIDMGDAADTAAKEEFVPLSEQYLYGHYTIGEFDGEIEKAFLEDMETMMVGGVEVAVIPSEIYCFPEGTLYRTGTLWELIDETGGDGAEFGNTYASRTYMDDLGMTKEEVFDGIVYTLFGDAVTTDIPGFYEENIKGQGDTAELVYVNRALEKKSLVGYYKVKDSVMEFSYLDLDENGQLMLCPFPYEVAFSNSTLMISKDNITRKLQPQRMLSNKHYVIGAYGGYTDNPAEAKSGISNIWLRMDDQEKSGFSADTDKAVVADSAVVYFTDGWRTEYATGTMGPGNRIEIRWEQQGNSEDAYARKEEAGSLTAYYLDCDYLGYILRIDDRDYFYQKTEKEYYAALVGDSVIDAEVETKVLEKMGMTKREMLSAMQDAMEAEFAAAGYTTEDVVNINERTGKITLKDGVLFDVNSSELSEEGMAYLSLLFAAMDRVIGEEGYGDYIDTIFVEGHTDSTGNYEENQVLSEMRAEAVDDYCYELYPHLSSGYIETAGYAGDRLIYDEGGNEDRDASRRVEIMIALDVDAFTDEEE